MIFVTGPLFAGKQTYIMEALGWDETAFKNRGVRDVQELAADLAEKFAAGPSEGSSVEPAGKPAANSTEDPTEVPTEKLAADPVDRESRNLSEALQKLADVLAQKEVVIATEIGGGVVPLDPGERRNREAAGRLACLLAGRADTVVRVCCGLPQFLKGQKF